MTTADLAITSSIGLTLELAARIHRGDHTTAAAIRAELHRRGYRF